LAARGITVVPVSVLLQRQAMMARAAKPSL